MHAPVALLIFNRPDTTERVVREIARARPARLPFKVVLLTVQEEAAVDFVGMRSLTGYTRDLSETGLTLMLSVVRIGDRYLTDREHYLGIRLELPGGPVSMLAASVRFEHTEGTDYLLGVRIIRIREEERAYYLTYLRTLSTKDRRQHTGDNARAAAPPAKTWITPAQVSEAFERFLRESAHPREL